MSTLGLHHSAMATTASKLDLFDQSRVLPLQRNISVPGVGR
jgi:hypothetical protein